MSGLLVGAGLVLLGAALLWISWAGSQHRLPPNAVAGIRLAAGPFGLGGGVACACGVATMFTGLDVIGIGLVVVGLAAVTTATGVATAVGLRAANAA